MTDDLYKGDDTTGLLTHFVGRVKRSFWSTLFAVTEGQAAQDFAHNTMLFWQNDVLDILQANYSASGPPVESVITSLGIGNGWHQTADEPALVYNEDDQDDQVKRFHETTAFMKFVLILSGQKSTYEKAVVLDGDGELGPVDLAGIRAVHAKNGVTTLRDARIWENMVFEFRGLGFPNRSNPDPKPRALPVRFLGVDESETPELTYTDSRSPAATQPASGALGAMPDNVAVILPQDKQEALTRLWGSSISREAFTRNAAVILRDDPGTMEQINLLLSESETE